MTAGRISFMSVGDYMFVVISLDEQGRPQTHISHYVFKNVNDANEFCAIQNSDTAEKSIVIQVRKMK